VKCVGAEIDLRVGGTYQIANLFPDGSTVSIVGVFEIVEAPRRLRFSWQLGSQQAESEQVTVTFEPSGAFTEVMVVHERITSVAMREGHARGWNGCLAGLARYVPGIQSPSL
jgi:uncharacterized protein YndB with AHSA1/START domain